MFSTILFYYVDGFYSKDDVQSCVPMFITQEQAEQIIQIQATQPTQATDNTNTTTTD